jgi:hypothetical protein
MRRGGRTDFATPTAFIHAAVFPARLMTSHICGVTATDPWTVTGVAILLTVVWIIAASFLHVGFLEERAGGGGL